MRKKNQNQTRQGSLIKVFKSSYMDFIPGKRGGAGSLLLFKIYLPEIAQISQII